VLILAFALKVHLGWSLLLLPIVFVIQVLLTQAVVTILATVNVFYRDVQELVNYGVTVLFFMTPIFYRPDIVPPRFSAIVNLNPLAAIIGAYHSILFSGTMPSFSRLGFALAASVVGLLVANATFERYRESFSQYL
jgi:lipopolysaccharide transport system permease protein